MPCFRLEGCVRAVVHLLHYLAYLVGAKMQDFRYFDMLIHSMLRYLIETSELIVLRSMTKTKEMVYFKG